VINIAVIIAILPITPNIDPKEFRITYGKYREPPIILFYLN
jgi:hypothetical protein